MRLASAFLIPAFLAVGATAASASAKLLEPDLHVVRSDKPAIRVALTFDACDGRTDERILSALIDNKIPATIFITAKWLKRNAAAFETMRAHPDLFELENHGARHVPAVDEPVKVYGISAAGSTDAVKAEVEGGAQALVAAGAPAPKWFRGATAKYTATSIELIHKLGFKVAGYSLNADGGSLLGAATTGKRIAAAKDGDVVIAHINQPTHAAGEGVVKGLLQLKSRGVTFVRLQDDNNAGSEPTTN
ncbi:polysaccharide deacetylase family protein [Mesorhizobium sp. INR15]|uniref:polysaccharide deacetylase family protein n=1 Tax=Mesorhizobium sp. INR15 TaxID=2654248 RepID=UPI0018964E30|nr:polysaccharide deacetylase family protein [Mesorhizobium sp. INR15]QPC94112.1 polysaccharide deacetylase family protein [Mesorhizobium sp. INR15]